MPTISELLSKGILELKKLKFETPRLDCELLIQHLLGFSKVELITKNNLEIKSNIESEFYLLLERRKNLEPIAYITGKKFFYDLEFEVGPGVLVPRPESEMVVDEALKWLKANSDSILNPKILDLGCGSGCIGLSILKNHPGHLWSVDISDEAIKYSNKNCQKLGLNKFVRIIRSSVGELSKLNLDGIEVEGFDLVVTNPPYISKNTTNLGPGVREFEPDIALFGGEKGFELPCDWALASLKMLKRGGCLIMEHGYDQGKILKTYMESKLMFKDVITLKDLAGLDRVTMGINANSVK